MNNFLNGKTCIVTGAARGIGKAIAQKYAEQGAKLVLIDLNKEVLEATAKELTLKKVNVLAIPINIASANDVNTAFVKIEEQFRQIDVLANCAGISVSKLLNDVTEEEWDRVLAVNLKSVFLLNNLVTRNMIKYKVKNGKIISISSQASKIGEVGNGPYCASKAGLNALTQVYALEMAQYGISVNNICPGYVDTELLRDVFAKRSLVEGKTPEEYSKQLTDLVPMNRLASPEEIAEFALFLSSDGANYITGTSMTIAGGRTII